MTRNLFLTFFVLIVTSLQGFCQIEKSSTKPSTRQDSVPEKKIVSWVLNDYIDSNRVAMDTVFYNRHHFNPNPGNIFLSSYGTPLILNNFIKREESEFLFSKHYSEYFRDPSETKYYRTRVPFTYLNFDTGGGDDAESDLEIFHSQNVNRLVNFGLDAKILSSQKFYERETSLKSHHITLFSSYEDTTYQLFASFISNKASHKHIGGVDDVKEIRTAGFLEEATSTIKSKHVDIKQRYYLGKLLQSKQNKQYVNDTARSEVDSTTAKSEIIQDSLKTNVEATDKASQNSTIGLVRKGFGLSHNFTFSINDYKYTDSEVSSEFYQPFPIYIDSSKTKDKARQRTLSNNLSVFFKSNHIDFNVGLEHNYNSYSYIFPFSPQDTVINKFDVSDKAFNNIQFTSNVQLKWNDNFSFNGSFDSWFFGYHKGDMDLDVKLKKVLKNSYLMARGQYFRKEPNFFLDQYNSNYFQWDNSFDKKNKLAIDLEYSNNKYDFKVAIQPRVIKNYIYLDTASLPKQKNRWIDYLSVFIEKDFHFWKMHLKNDFQYQYSNYTDILGVPTFYVHQSLAFRHTFHFGTTGGELKSQLGIGYYYFSGYKANAFMPALSLYHKQNEIIIGDRPLVNVFANLKLKRTSFYVKAYHANSFMDKKNYYSAPNYPISDLMIKIGILWTFYN